MCNSKLVPSRYLSVFWGERRLGIRLRRVVVPSSLLMRSRARLNLIPNLLSPQKTLKQRLSTSLAQLLYSAYAKVFSQIKLFQHHFKRVFSRKWKHRSVCVRIHNMKITKRRGQCCQNIKSSLRFLITDLEDLFDIQNSREN